MWSAKTDGRPNSGLPVASFSQSVQAPPVGFAVQGRSRVHRPEAGSVSHRTQSDDHEVVFVNFDLARETAPRADDAFYSLAVSLLRKRRLVTRVFNSNRTPRSSSHFWSGRTMESYWLRTVRMIPLRWLNPATMWVNRNR